MENLPSHNTLFSVLLFLQLSSHLLLSSAYTLPDKYFINCGSDSNDTVADNRNFVGDKNSGPYSLSPGDSIPVKETNTTSSQTPTLYQTARVYRHPSQYQLSIDASGTYLVRLHFYLIQSSMNLSSALFNVSASGFLLLSNFSVRNSSNSPVIKEFLLSIEAGKFGIFFEPYTETSLAFVSAIEVFLAPPSFIPDNATRVNTAGGNTSTYNGLLSQVLRTVHRINVGGNKITPENDTLWRYWIPDDDYLFSKDAAKNSGVYFDKPKYQLSTEYIAPDRVYKTAKELNIDPNRATNFFNITWCFGVTKNGAHLVRVHFCDIISPSLNVLQFNLYINTKFGKMINPYDIIDQLAAPFYFDFVVDSDDSGFLNISVGPRHDSYNPNAFLNGLEIMELMKGSGSVPKGDEKPKGGEKRVFVLVASVVGGFAIICTLMAAAGLLHLKRRKAKPVDTFDWPSRGGSSYNGITEITANAFPIPNLNLGLKIPFADILEATNYFNSKLMIGEGGFGKVYKGTLGGMKVAVKRSEPGHGQGLPEFQTEIMVLSKIRHRHLVSLIGYCDEMSEMILVYEFMEKGTLRDHLYGNSGRSSTGFEMSWPRRLEICIGAARGLHYLHTGAVGGIIHRDVKSTNILLDENYVAKVADFGLSKSGPLDQTHVSTGVKGSFGYLDPEYFRCLQLTEKSDVYSFGVVLLEVLCARPAVNNMLPREEVNLAEWGMSWQRKGQLEKIIDPVLVSTISPSSLRKFGETAEKCLRECGVDRPAMGDVLWDLEYALQLQRTAVRREPHEDSATDASLQLQMHVVQNLPSHNVPIEEDVILLGHDGLDTTASASEVFSQLKIDGAR